MTDATTQLALMIDLERCTGCKSCEAACKQTNALGPNSYRNRVMWFDEQLPPGLSARLPGIPQGNFQGPGHRGGFDR
jgi:Fe-S-cluster-containing dehydrogenase component